MMKMYSTKVSSYLLPFVDTKDTICVITVFLNPVQFSRITPVFCQIFLYNDINALKIMHITKLHTNKMQSELIGK